MRSSAEAADAGSGLGERVDDLAAEWPPHAPVGDSPEGLEEDGHAEKPAGGRFLPRLGTRPGGALRKPSGPRVVITPEQRVLLLDTWQRSGLPAGDFAALVGVSKHTLYAWKKRFEELGPAGLMDQARAAPKGSRLPELTKRTILMLKQAIPSGAASGSATCCSAVRPCRPVPAAVARVLHEAGYESGDVPTRPHPDQVRSFERATPNQLWQTDLFTFVLKRQNRRVYLVAFMDDHSRFITGYGLHASQSAALVLEVLRAAMAAYGTPEEILTDNGSQYVTWRGKSQFTADWRSGASSRSWPSPTARRRWARSNASGARCGGSASRRPCSSTWTTPGGGSGCSSTITTSSVPIRGSTAWCRPTASSAPPPRSSRRCAARVRPTRWNWPATACPSSLFYLTGQLEREALQRACRRRSGDPAPRRRAAGRDRSAAATGRSSGRAVGRINKRRIAATGLPRWFARGRLADPRKRSGSGNIGTG